MDFCNNNFLVTLNPLQPPVNESTFSNEQQQPNGVAYKESVEKLVEPQQFTRENLMLQEKIGEGEYGPIYRYNYVHG